MNNGTENLVPMSERSKEEARENGKKGGKASGESRRRKADMRKLAQDILDNTYKTKTGQEVTGAELVVQTIMANLADPKGRNWAKAMDLLVELTGADKSADEKARIKAEAKMAQQRAKDSTGSGDGVTVIVDV